MLGSKGAASTIPVTNLERAKQWYQDVLGLKPAHYEAPGHFALNGGGGTIVVIYERGASKADHTLASFEVEDLDAAVADLKQKGVKFEDYDFPGLKTVNGIATIGSWRGGWFKDPDGNIFGIGQGAM